MHNPSTTRLLLRCGAVAGPIFVTVALVEGRQRADYHPRRHPISSLALGPRGAVQTANFSLAGVLYAALATGLARTPARWARPRPGPVLIGLVAGSLIGAAAFRTDPVSGYPPGTPDLLTDRTRAGVWHDLVSIPVFLGLPATAVVYARSVGKTGDRGWAVYSIGTAAGMLGAFVVASAGFAQVPRFVEVGGLFQRVAVITGLGWLSALAVRALRSLRT